MTCCENDEDDTSQSKCLRSVMTCYENDKDDAS